MSTLAALQSLIASGESATLELKRSTAGLRRAGETLCAFLNGEAVRAAPLFGVGYRGFRECSARAFHAERGEHYEQPHGLVPGLAAKHCLLGALVVPLWLVLLYRGWRASALEHAVLAFLLIGAFIDVDRLRELWVLWGFLAGQGGGGRGSTERRL